MNTPTAYQPDIDDKTKYELQNFKLRLAFMILEGAGGKFEINLGVLSSNRNFQNIIYGQKKKYAGKKKIHPEKKKYR